MSRWLMRFAARPDAALRLVCFAHAGGNAVFYRPWSLALPTSVDVVGVQLPGRLDRMSERCETVLHAAADAITDAIRGDGDGPVALFGHSMGTLMAYEVARRLALTDPDGVRHLLVSGRYGPRVEARTAYHRADASVLWGHTRELNGTDDGVFAHPQLMELALPALRADYQMVEEYRWRPGPALRCPITALTGDADPEVTPEQMMSWARETESRFRLHEFAGDHFYLIPGRAAVLDTVSAAIGIAVEKING